MSHQRFQELVALRAFDECSVEDQRELELHLGSCAECRTLELELTQGLLRAVQTDERAERAPAWSPAMDRRWSAPRRPRWTWVAIAASFAAGWLCAIVALERPDSPGRGSIAERTSPNSFARSTPPPLARTASAIARWTTSSSR